MTLIIFGIDLDKFLVIHSRSLSGYTGARCVIAGRPTSFRRTVAGDRFASYGLRGQTVNDSTPRTDSEVRAARVKADRLCHHLIRPYTINGKNCPGGVKTIRPHGIGTFPTIYVLTTRQWRVLRVHRYYLTTASTTNLGVYVFSVMSANENMFLFFSRVFSYGIFGRRLGLIAAGCSRCSGPIGSPTFFVVFKNSLSSTPRPVSPWFDVKGGNRFRIRRCIQDFVLKRAVYLCSPCNHTVFDQVIRSFRLRQTWFNCK